jgi:hypothetical protein
MNSVLSRAFLCRPGGPWVKANVVVAVSNLHSPDQKLSLDGSR